MYLKYLQRLKEVLLEKYIIWVQMFYDIKTKFVIVFNKDNYIQTIQHVFKDNLSIYKFAKIQNE